MAVRSVILCESARCSLICSLTDSSLIRGASAFCTITCPACPSKIRRAQATASPVPKGSGWITISAAPPNAASICLALAGDATTTIRSMSNSFNRSTGYWTISLPHTWCNGLERRDLILWPCPAASTIPAHWSMSAPHTTPNHRLAGDGIIFKTGHAGPAPAALRSLGLETFGKWLGVYLLIIPTGCLLFI